MDQANYLFQSISGSKATDWNFQSVKYLHELVRQYGGRKSGDREAEFRERIRKEWACLRFGGNCWVSDFSARPVFKGGWPNSENSKLVKALTVPKVTSRNQDMQLGLTGIGRRAPPRRVSQGSGSAPPVSV